jgi:surfactin synthase thioesterase subunit
VPRVVFFPGASGAAVFLTPVSDRMPDGWPTRLLGWPGAGAEPHDPAITDYGALVDRAAAAVANCSDVVAQSMGGVVAVGLALVYPEDPSAGAGLDLRSHRRRAVRRRGGRARPRADVPNLERVVRLPDASHWVHHDEPERVSALLIDFFKR